MNNKVNFLRGTSTEYATSTKDNDTFYYTTDDKKLYLGNKEITGIEIDDTTTTATDKTWSAKHIDETITSALANKADSSDIPTKTSELTNDSGYLTSADGGNADKLDGLHATSFLQNIPIWNTTDSVYDLVLNATSSGFVFIRDGVKDMPKDNLFWFGLINVGVVHKSITVYEFNGTWAGYNNYNSANQTWTGWKSFSDATSVNGHSIEITDVDPGEGVAMESGKIVMVVEP